MKECPECHTKALKCIDSTTEYEFGIGSTTVFRAYVCDKCGRYFESREEIRYQNWHNKRRRKR